MKLANYKQMKNSIRTIKAIAKKGILPITILLLTYSCAKDENNNFTPIKAQEGTISAEIGSPPSKSVYVDLSTGKTTTATVNSWDLAFESTGKTILINTGKKANITNTTLTDFADITNTANDKYTFEQTDGDLSKTAMGDWTSDSKISKKEVYILNLGINAKGNALGYKKLVVLQYESGKSFQIKYADMDGTNEQIKTINTASNQNFTYFSLTSGNTVTVEPESEKWDIVFTPISVRTGPPHAVVYRLAASAQTNSYKNVGVVTDDPWSNLASNNDDDPASERNTKDISDSNYNTIAKSNYINPSTQANTIGRNWLQILKPHRAGNFKVYNFMTFIIKDTEGKHFKLRFTGYKNPNTGKNGNPQFEYKELL